MPDNGKTVVELYAKVSLWPKCDCSAFKQTPTDTFSQWEKILQVKNKNKSKKKKPQNNALLTINK